MTGAEIDALDELECVLLTGQEVVAQAMRRIGALPCQMKNCRPEWTRIEGTFELARLLFHRLRSS